MSATYSIILPIYNQQQNLPLILYLLHQVSQLHALSFQIVIVEDNSIDKTRQIAYLLASHYTSLNITVIERPSKLGLGSAYREGLSSCRGEYVIIMDADLSHHPKYIPIMKATGHRLRYCDRQQVSNRRRRRRMELHAEINQQDCQLRHQACPGSGLQRFHRELQALQERLEQLMGSTRTKGYSFQMEILVRAHRRQFKVEQIPIVFVDRLFGESKLGASEVLIYLRGVAELFLEE